MFTQFSNYASLRKYNWQYTLTSEENCPSASVLPYPYQNFYPFNSLERFGTSLLYPLDRLILTIKYSGSHLKKCAAVAVLLFAAVIGLIGAAIKETGKYFNPHNKNYQAACQACSNVWKANAAFESIDNKIKKKTKNQTELENLKQSREVCLSSLRDAISAFNQATETLYGHLLAQQRVKKGSKKRPQSTTI